MRFVKQQIWHFFSSNFLAQEQSTRSGVGRFIIFIFYDFSKETVDKSPTTNLLFANC
jgi:hypothetical protein